MSLLRNPLRVLFVLWAGSLWSLAAWVALTLFRMLPDRHLAGEVAARYFSVETWLGLIVMALALLLPGRGRLTKLYAAVGLLAVNEWLLKRLMGNARVHGAAYGLTFGAWHGVSAVLYLIACAAVLIVVWRDELR
jgi:hypothetical protein